MKHVLCNTIMPLKPSAVLDNGRYINITTGAGGVFIYIQYVVTLKVFLMSFFSTILYIVLLISINLLFKKKKKKCNLTIYGSNQKRESRI